MKPTGWSDVHGRAFQYELWILYSFYVRLTKSFKIYKTEIISVNLVQSQRLTVIVLLHTSIHDGLYRIRLSVSCSWSCKARVNEQSIRGDIDRHIHTSIQNITHIHKKWYPGASAHGTVNKVVNNKIQFMLISKNYNTFTGKLAWHTMAGRQLVAAFPNHLPKNLYL